jgi:hypothetical protein
MGPDDDLLGVVVHSGLVLHRSKDVVAAIRRITAFPRGLVLDTVVLARNVHAEAAGRREHAATAHRRAAGTAQREDEAAAQRDSEASGRRASRQAIAVPQRGRERPGAVGPACRDRLTLSASPLLLAGKHQVLHLIWERVDSFPGPADWWPLLTTAAPSGRRPARLG